MTQNAIEPIVPGSLRDQIRIGIDEYLRDPLAFPSEFVSWIPQRVEQVGIVTPQSNVIGSYTTADSVGGLGTPVHGKTVMIRAGTSPYHFAQLTYDDVYGKWVSTVVLNSSLSSFVVGGATSTFTNVSETANAGRTQIPGFKALYTAGLRPQTHMMAFGSSNTAQTNSLRPAIYEVSNGDASLNKVAHGGQIDWVGITTPQQWRITSGWSDATFTATPADAEAVLSFQYDSDTSGIQANNISVLMRWVANPV